MHALSLFLHVVIAYVGGYRGNIVNMDSVAVEKLTHINYAFVNIKNGEAFLQNERTDTVNLRNLVGAKKRNPDLKVLISIGGWSWSKGFSDAVLTDSSRLVFARSAVALVARYELDGIDIDWEYPGMVGDGNVFRQEDGAHYTAMFRSLRSCLDSLGRLTGRTYLVTTAVGASAAFLQHTSMGEAAVYLDYVNVMSYDFKDEEDSSGHHTNLFASASDWGQRSADKAIRQFEAAGVPAAKLVMGSGFYGHGWKMASVTGHGLYQATVGPFRAGGYTHIKDSLMREKGFKRYWDKKAKAPYLFSAREKVFVSYDDERSVREKCRYISRNGLGGIMFWEYASDPKEYLLDAITKEFRR